MILNQTYKATEKALNTEWTFNSGAGVNEGVGGIDTARTLREEVDPLTISSGSVSGMPSNVPQSKLLSPKNTPSGGGTSSHK